MLSLVLGSVARSAGISDRIWKVVAKLDMTERPVDLADLLVLGISGLQDMIAAFFSKTHTEQTKQKTSII